MPYVGRLSLRKTICPWYLFLKQFLKPYGKEAEPLSDVAYWKKSEDSNTEHHSRPKIGLSEAGESIGENAALIKQTLEDFEPDEIVKELEE